MAMSGPLPASSVRNLRGVVNDPPGSLRNDGVATAERLDGDEIELRIRALTRRQLGDEIARQVLPSGYREVACEDIGVRAFRGRTMG
jgi:hypothetical protein